MSQYRRLTLVEREELSRLFVAGHTVRAAARALGRAPSTVSRELARHYRTRVTYRAVRAHTRASRWAHIARKPRKLAIQPALRQAVFCLLAQRWSPEQIARALPQRYPQTPTMRISHEAIYTYLYVLPRGALKRELILYLRRRHRFRRPHKLRLSSRPIQDFTSIEERPAEVAARTVPGHWEGDLLVDHGQCVCPGDAGGADDALYAPGATQGEGGRSRIPVRPGSGEPMRTPTGCCASSFPKARASLSSRARTSSASRRCLTIARAKC